MTDHLDSPTLSSSTSSSGQSGSTGTSLKDDAAQLGSKAADRLVSAADSRKSSVAEPVREVSGALNAAADQLANGDANTPTWLADGIRSVATGIGDLAQRIESGDSRQLLSDVQMFARQRPGLFLAGCAAAGFAVARVLRAGAAPSGNNPIGVDTVGTTYDDAGGMNSGRTTGSSGAASYTPPAGQEPLPTPAMGAGSL